MIPSLAPPSAPLTNYNQRDKQKGHVESPRLFSVLTSGSSGSHSTVARQGVCVACVNIATINSLLHQPLRLLRSSLSHHTVKQMGLSVSNTLLWLVAHYALSTRAHAHTIDAIPPDHPPVTHLYQLAVQPFGDHPLKSCTPWWPRRTTLAHSRQGHQCRRAHHNPTMVSLSILLTGFTHA